MRSLGSDERLKSIRPEIAPALAEASKYSGVHIRKISASDRKAALQPVLEQMNAAERTFMIEVIQLMQNVHTEFRLEHASNRSNPRNAGWMSTFRMWASSRALQAVWTNVQHNYNPLFGRFMSMHLLDDDTDVQPRP
jgi:hypothetical protein